MRNKLFPLTPPALIVLAVLVFLTVLLSREASVTEALPAFLSHEQGLVSVELTGVGIVPGVYQFYDGLSLFDVIKLTAPSLVKKLSKESVWSQPIRDGESLLFVKKGRQIEVLQQGWMLASHRLAMAIPLHPDRMSIHDWTALPGIGATLADRIENERQKNGDYESLNALIRVKGVGVKRISSWKRFFSES